MIYITGDTHGRLERFSFDDGFRTSVSGTENHIIICGDFGAIWHQDSNRQRSRRIDMYEIIVLERSGTFQHYFVRGVLQ